MIIEQEKAAVKKKAARKIINSPTENCAGPSKKWNLKRRKKIPARKTPSADTCIECGAFYSNTKVDWIKCMGICELWACETFIENHEEYLCKDCIELN